MVDAPERIWARPDYNECWKKRLEEEDVEYIRADLIDPAAIRAAALREAENALRDWQDNLNQCRSPETAIVVGMSADVVHTLIDKEPTK